MPCAPAAPANSRRQLPRTVCLAYLNHKARNTTPVSPAHCHPAPERTRHRRIYLISRDVHAHVCPSLRPYIAPSASSSQPRQSRPGEMNAVWTPYIGELTALRNAGRTTSAAVVNRGASSLFAAPRCLPSLQQTRASSETGVQNSPTSLATRDLEVFESCQLRLKQIVFSARAPYTPSSLQRTLIPFRRGQGIVGSTTPPVMSTRMSGAVRHIAPSASSNGPGR
ncbi:hypothetical protein K466DRAFT_185958 [Polyporus arcularius HHB13444]|uniref:Uncharacterized protein n=1 Tax=Polyporus arcularius HHB13444 TaxID=1314778 RepID=A0A5C3P7K9_9APHY|nr:hypothetical protein K466DRAFT_185958 [Polyporus arcularius HHB13444]